MTSLRSGLGAWAAWELETTCLPNGDASAYLRPCCPGVDAKEHCFSGPSTRCTSFHRLLWICPKRNRNRSLWSMGSAMKQPPIKSCRSKVRVSNGLASTTSCRGRVRDVPGSSAVGGTRVNISSRNIAKPRTRPRGQSSILCQRDLRFLRATENGNLSPNRTVRFTRPVNEASEFHRMGDAYRRVARCGHHATTFALQRRT